MSEPVWVPLGAAGVTPWTILFTPAASEPWSTFATFDTRNRHAVLDFDDTIGESVVFHGVLPATYLGKGLNVRVIWAATTAITGAVVWEVSFERLSAGGQDLDVDSFGSLTTAVGTCDSVSGETTETVIAVPAGAGMDSLAAGEFFRMKIKRDTASASDTMVGDAELLAVVVTEQ